jgi:hypothetical protein
VLLVDLVGQGFALRIQNGGVVAQDRLNIRDERFRFRRRVGEDDPDALPEASA